MNGIVCTSFDGFLRALLFFCIVVGLPGCVDVPEDGPTTAIHPVDSSIQKLLQRAIDIRDTDTDSALVLATLVQKKSVEKGYHKGVIDGLLSEGMIRMNAGDLLSARDRFRKAYYYATIYKSNDLGPIANNLGCAFLYAGVYDSAAYYFRECIHRSLVHRQKVLRSSKYSKEMKELINKETGNFLIVTYSNLANVFLKLQQKSEALRYLEQAEKVYEALPASAKAQANIGHVYVARAEVYTSLGMGDEAERFLRLALAVSGRRPYSEARQVALARLGNVYLTRKQPERALPVLLESQQLAAQALNTHPYHRLIEPAQSLAMAYMQLEEYPKAEELLLKAIAAADSLKVLTGLDETYRILSDVYRHSNQPSKALAALDKHLFWKDSLLTEKQYRTVNQLELSYRSAEKDKELARQQLLITKQRSNLREQRIGIASVSVIALLLTALATSLYRSGKHRQRLHQAEIKSLDADKHIDRLKAMVKGEEKERTRLANELHDNIVGQLAAIRMNFTAVQHQFRLQHIKAYTEAMQQLGDAAEDVRRTAHNLMPSVLLQGGLAAAIDHFCRKTVSSTTINFQCYGVLPVLDPEFELSIYRIVQELVHNAIKHGKAQHIVVQLNSSHDQLLLTIEDDGTGISKAELPASSGFGLKNIRTRVRAYNGQIQIETEQGKGTTVYIEFETAVFKGTGSP